MTEFDFIISSLKSHAEPSKAPAMKAYMKGKFEFLGVNAPLRKSLYKAFFEKYPIGELNDEFWILIRKLWDNEYRECQYFAIDILQKVHKRLAIKDIQTMEFMITAKSWWDTVDGIAPVLVGSIFSRFPDQRDTYITQWIESDNIWLQRSAIIFQLKYKNETDWNLLKTAILSHDDSKEFFVRKAQGWALRQYSKYEPLKVMAFVEANPQLSGLTKMEATRNIKK